MSRVAALWDEWETDDYFGDPLGPFESSGVPGSQTFPDSPLGIRVALALGANPAADPTTDFSWTDITAYVMLADGGIEIHRGRGDWQTQISPSWCTMRLNNADGRFARLNPTGAYYGQLAKNTPIRVQVNPGTGWVTRFVGFVSEWPPRWTHGQHHQWVPIRADGVLRRLGQGRLPVRSALRWAITDDQFNLVAYWPLETVALDSPTHPAQVGVVKAAGAVSLVNDGPVGSAGAVRLTSPSSIVSPTDPYPGVIVLPLDYTPSSTNLTIGFWFRQTRALAGQSETGRNPMRGSFFILTTGTVGFLTFEWLSDPDSVFTGSAVTFGQGSPASGATEATDICDGAWHHIVLLAQQSGANVNVFLYIDEVLVAGAALATVTLGTVTELNEFGSTFFDTDKLVNFPNEYDLAHLAVYDGSRQADNNTRIALAGLGNAGETDVDRFNRVCDLAGIPHVTATGDGIALGPQPILDSVAVLRDDEAAGQGVLYEALTGGLAYQPVSARYNLPVSLALDINQGHIVAPFEPADDDRLTRNDITVNRRDGGRYQAVDEDSIAAVGRTDEELTLGLHTDDQVRDIATWRLRVGTSTDDDYRYPTVELRLRKSSSLVTAWLACDLGSRVTIDNLPTSVTFDLVDQSVEGYTERISSVAYDVSANLAPYEPWRVQQLTATPPAHDVLDGWLVQDTFRSRAAFAAGTDTSMTVDVVPRITTDADDMPMRMRASGSLLETTAVASTVATFVAAGASSAALDNAAVTPVLPAGVTTGDRLFVAARFRSTAGTLAINNGYELVAQIGNLYVWTKIHSGSETDPTVTPSGGAAGDTVSARTFGVRDLPTSLTVAEMTQRLVSQSNASAQDVAFPAMATPTTPGCLVLLVAGKSDDHSAVSTPATFTLAVDHSTVTGDDQSMLIYYQIQTTATATAAGSITVTGGAAAVSEAMVLALVGGYQTLTVTQAPLNGVSKTIAAATDITLADPLVLAL